MIRIILYLAFFGLIIYLAIWLKKRYTRLEPKHKKQLIYFVFGSAFRFLKTKWHWIFITIWQVVKRLMR